MPDLITLITLITCLNCKPSLSFPPPFWEDPNCPYKLGLPSLFIYTLLPPFFLEGPNYPYEPGHKALIIPTN